MRRRLGASLLAVAGAVALAVWATWPLATCLGSCVVDPAGSDASAAALRRDIDLVRWILAWDVHALAAAPARLFDANVFHPAPLALATTEHLLGALPLYAPLAVVTGSPLAAHQTTLLATFVGTALAAAALVRDWTGSWTGAGVAAVLFACSPFRAAHLPALHVEGALYLPLVLLCARRAAVGEARGWPIALAATLAAQALWSYYLGYAALAAAAVLLACVLALDASARRSWARLVWPVVAAGVVVAVVSIPYLLVRRAGALDPPDLTFVRWASARPLRTGATPAVLLALATAPWWRRGVAPRTGTAWLVATAAIGVAGHLLALGPVLEAGGIALPTPFALAAATVPGWSLVRIPLRLNVLAGLAAATLAGVGVAGAVRTAPRTARPLLAAACLGAALASVPLAFPAIRLAADGAGTAPPVYGWLARQPSAPLVEIPFHDFRLLGPGMDVEARRLVWSTAHWHPLLGGYSGYEPATYPAVSALVDALPDARALDLLVRTTGLARIVLHRGGLEAAERARWDAATDRLAVEATLGDAVVLAPRARRAPDLLAAFVGGARAAATPLGTPRARLPDADRRAGVAFDPPPTWRPWLHRVGLRVRVRNDGTRPWPALGSGRAGLVTLGTRWRAARGGVVAERADAGRLPWDLAPGETVVARVGVRPPGIDGPLVLEVELVQDGQWFGAPAVRCFTAAGAATPCETRQRPDS